jgi:hypothetical protein
MSKPTETTRNSKSLLGFFKKRRETTMEPNLQQRPSFWNKVARSASMIFNPQQTLASTPETPKDRKSQGNSGQNSSNIDDSDSDDEAHVIVEKNRFSPGSLSKNELKILEQDLSLLDDDLWNDIEIKEEEPTEEKGEEKKLKNRSFSDIRHDGEVDKIQSFLSTEMKPKNKLLKETQNVELGIQKKTKSETKMSTKSPEITRLNSLSKIINFKKEEKQTTKTRNFSEIKNEKKSIERQNSLGSSQFEKGKTITKRNSFINSSLVRIDSFKITFEQEEDEEVENSQEEEIEGDQDNFPFNLTKEQVNQTFLSHFSQVSLYNKCR